MPRVSIVMTVFNESQALPTVFESIFAQTYDDYELIVVDNGSTDDSVSICKEYESQDTRVSVFENRVNVGPIQNMHRCLWRATGEYVRLQSANDVSLPNELSDLVAELDSDPSIGLAYATHADPMDSYPNLIQDNPIERIRTHISEFYSGHLIYGLIRREIVDRCSPISYRMSPDQIYLAEIALYSKISACDTKSYNRTNHNRSTEVVAKLCSAVWPRMIDEPIPFENEALVYPPYLDCYVGYGKMIDCARVTAAEKKDLHLAVKDAFMSRWRGHLLLEIPTFIEHVGDFLEHTESNGTDDLTRKYGARLLDAVNRYAILGIPNLQLPETAQLLTTWLHNPVIHKPN